MKLSSHVIFVALVSAFTWLQVTWSGPVDAPEWDVQPRRPQRKCEAIQAPICKQLKFKGYNQTFFPNIYEHHSQLEAMTELADFKPLVDANCYDHLATLLCSLYLPLCMPEYQNYIPPCRSMCLAARRGCEVLMNQYLYAWPPVLNCTKYTPEDPRALCIKAMEPSVTPATPETKPPTEPTTESPTKPPTTPYTGVTCKGLCMNGGRCYEGESRCDCRYGYSGEVCQYSGMEFLLIAQGGAIKRMSLPYSPTSYGYLTSTYYHDVVALDYDCVERRVYFADLTDGSIGSVGYEGEERRAVLTDVGDPEGIAVDWLGRNLFWTDSKSKSIRVANLGSPYRKVLFSTGIQRPRAIVCHPMLGKIAWTDWYRQKPKIEWSSMSGFDREVLVSSKHLRLPNSLTISYQTDELCWSDSALGQIACISMDHRRTLRIILPQSVYPFALAVFRGKVLWTDWSNNFIAQRDLLSTSEDGAFPNGITNDGRVYDMKIAPTRCPRERNVCSGWRNGGCWYFCLMRDATRRDCINPDFDDDFNRIL